MALEDMPVTPRIGDLPGPVSAFLADADQYIKDYFSVGPDRPIGGFVPSDYPPIYQTLGGLIDLGFDPGLFCEWGSGFGVVSGLAAMLGHEAHGIEIDSDLIEPARELLEEHDLDVSIHSGSYVPGDFDDTEQPEDFEFLTVVPGPSAYDEIGLDLDEFDVVFVFPWPGTESLHFEMFDRYAAPGCILISHHGVNGNRVQRKVD